MVGEARLLAELLSLIALMAATIEYSQVIRRRVDVRERIAFEAEAAASGLRGLVRVLGNE